MPTPPPTTVAAVIARLREIERELAPSDGAAVFDTMYLRVTEVIAAELAGGGGFTDGELMAELDVRFACRWLAAYDAAAGAVPAAWAPLFEQRGSDRIWPVQFALAGMNAHIENDLPLAVVDTCLARGVSPTESSVHADYERVNTALASVESEIRRGFLTEAERRLDDEIGPLVHLVSAWDIGKARDLAWVTAQTLWAMRPLGELYDRYVAMLGHTVGMASRCLLTPVGPRP